MNRYTLPINKQPSGLLLSGWLFAFLPLLGILIFSCTKEESKHQTTLFLKTGTLYTHPEAYIPVGGKIQIGVLASGGGVPLTYIRIVRISGNDTVVQVDRGIYAGTAGFDADYSFSKDTSAKEVWEVLVMNSDRVKSTQTLIINRGDGVLYGDITHISSVQIGFQDNTTYAHFLDLDQGIAYSAPNLAGHEAEIDILGYYYVTSGLPSPSLTCPGYTAANGFYPELSGWPVKNTTLFDYKSTDNNLITIEQFDAAVNDSLLVTAYKPDKVSGNCKYCYTGKVIPFKTQEGKYGLIKVLMADQLNGGSMEMEIKIQK
ncbi:MAG: hypothetical protein IPH88_00035 [Bacteroidales bacterium]|nr:hypothetical protein [Bacteroidales bacterium]